MLPRTQKDDESGRKGGFLGLKRQECRMRMTWCLCAGRVVEKGGSSRFEALLVFHLALIRG